MSVSGFNIATLGVPVCWFTALENGHLPSDPFTAFGFSQLVNGTFEYKDSTRTVSCPLIKNDDLNEIAIVILNDGLSWSPMSYATFTYNSGVLI